MFSKDYLYKILQINLALYVLTEYLKKTDETGTYSIKPIPNAIKIHACRKIGTHELEKGAS